MNGGTPANSNNTRYFRLCPKCSEPIVSEKEPESVSDALCHSCEGEYWGKLNELECQKNKLMSWGEASFIEYWEESEWQSK